MSGQHRGPMVAFMVVALVCAGLLFHESRGRAGSNLLHPSQVPAAAASSQTPGRSPDARSTSAAELEATPPSRPATAPPTTAPSQTQGTSIPGSPRAKLPGAPEAGRQRDQAGESNHTMQAKKAGKHRKHRRAQAQQWQPPGADPVIIPPSEPAPPAP